MATMQPAVLLVEDDVAMRSLLCDEVWDLGCRIVEASDGDEALRRAMDIPPDVIVTDLRMPSGGLDYLSRLQTAVPACPIIVMTAFGDGNTKNETLKLGAAAYFDKPVRMTELKGAIGRFIKKDGSLPRA